MSPHKILVRFPNPVGDAVMATPALRALRAAHPDATIAVETRPRLEPLLAGLDSFDHFLPAPRGARATLARAGELRRGGFDCAVLLSDSASAATPAALARTPRRIGCARTPLQRALLTESVPPQQRDGQRTPTPMVKRYLAIVAALGCEARGREVELALDPRVSERVSQRLAHCGIGPDAPYLVASPGANFGASKIWPAGHFATACDAIRRRHGLATVLAPGPHDEVDAHRVADAMEERCVVLERPQLDLGELKALIAGAKIVLTNDTGPRQIAVAFDRPVVVVMGPTDPRHTAGQLERQRVLREVVPCGPCHQPRCSIDHRCMTAISPFRAIAAAKDLLP